MKSSRSREIGSLNYRIALNFDRHFGSTTADVPIKFRSDHAILNTNLAASRLCEILRLDLFRLIQDPGDSLRGSRDRRTCPSDMVHSVLIQHSSAVSTKKLCFKYIIISGTGRHCLHMHCFLSVCLSVSLSVCKITEKHVGRFWWIFQDNSGITRGTNDDFLSVCLSVSLSVCKITEKHVGRFWWIFQDNSGITRGTNDDEIPVVFQVLIWVEFVLFCICFKLDSFPLG